MHLCEAADRGRGFGSIPSPAGCRCHSENLLLKVLHLLANFLQLGLARHYSLRDLGVIRLCPKSVELAKNFLNDEFERAPDWLFFAQMLGELREVNFRSCTIFRDVGAVGAMENILSHPIVIFV